MRSAIRLPSSDLFPRRTAALILVVVVHLLMLLMLLSLTPAMEFLDMGRKALTVDLLPDQPATPEPARRARSKRAGGASGKRTPAPEPAPAPSPPPPPVPVPDNTPLALIPLTSDQMAAGDISRLPSRAPGPRAGPDLADNAGNGDADSDGATGPNGEKLYAADWYREPTHAELAFYLPKNGVRSGWGMIACQTFPDFHVDNCQELGQSPGSGLARAVRQAAWQFRVRPPRVGGRPMVGAWVRIRIDFTETNAMVRQ
ncbi:energy transducer TonB [Sphingomonas quercus]|uniref:Energy transducer TonB n=1 Tax=Sphingomonas quercus TaxID=2842451 RepID=A0ABS6BK20_9SPHN|nr:energy transducer TonB [Sphingomonas quercus]MBU3078638.1 energy transducer TonB [Sphingomonas quercus]